MRITADILDDDTFVPVINLEKSIQSQDSEEENSSPIKHKSQDDEHIPKIHSNLQVHIIPKIAKIQHYHNVNEITQQFENLHVSEISSSIQRKFPSTAFKLITKDMEKSENSDVDPAPAWLMQYLSKMKAEIKKEIVEEILNVSHDLSSQQSTSSLKTEEESADFQREVIHHGIFCDNCDQLIHGIRYKCGNCSDFDLCQECESLPNIHNKNHVFLKIRYPVAFKLYQKQKLEQLVSSVPGEIYTISSKNRQARMLYDAKFLSDEKVSDGTVLAPSTRFIKIWKVQNAGTRAWTDATKLQHIQDSSGLIPAKEEVSVPHLKPLEEGTVSVLFTAPDTPGIYKSYWKFSHKNRTFGHTVWCHIVVKDPLADEKKINIAPEKLKAPTIEIPEEKEIENQRNEVASIEQVLTAVKEEHDKGNIVPRKLAVSSYTATPNNTPFDLTPPKSPDHHEIAKEIQGIAVDDGASRSKNNDSDDECGSFQVFCSISSVSSVDSDTEFVVIPMPKCFNLSESFVSNHMPHLDRFLRSNTDNKTEVKDDGKLVSEGSSSKETYRHPACVTETVSQETGVPELPEQLEKDLRRSSLKDNKKEENTFSNVVTDGSSSEVSIIESEGNSPTVENMPTIDSISIAYPVPEVFKDEVIPKENVLVESCNEEQSSEALGSATFPKFPVEGITSAYEPLPPNHNYEERTIQVLPEGLVTGALSAAASVYNTACAVISTIQQPRNERGLSRDPPVLSSNETARHITVENPMDQLVEMGFCNRHQNEQLLRKHKGDVALAVAELVSLNDNDWYASRHVPPSPPDLFD
ncbi:LOW QUALITY PROTEIN: next to BRCA1 gene 1 protein-like [Uloborus diversus]|uniref:LOW QUALITY PROTEIN: next to BRCA1 gene 1 protein-like n=1 Tax=Uloborus diversus TaxID=327109 RepID=UPI002409E704|nr:LOW QUALITY PROTEIN: next to BRCA1 gene 1 protein-like [Uloborus diversus]